MKENQKEFLLLLQGFIGNSKNTEIHNPQDAELLAKTHMCIPFVYQGALNLGFTPPEEWRKQVLTTVAWNYKNLQIQSSLLKKLSSVGIKCAILKGSSVAVNYSVPIYRQLGDIDILVKECDYERAIDVLTGSAERNAVNPDHKFHYGFAVNGVSVEVHKHVTEYTESECGKKTAEFMDKALDNLIYAAYDGFEFPMLDIEHQALTLILHTKRHLIKNKLSMRMLCDWAVFVQSISDDEWNEKVSVKISELGLERFSSALTGICDKYFATDCARKVSVEFDDQFKECLISEFLNGGAIDSEVKVSENVGSIYAAYKSKGKNSISACIHTLNYFAVSKFKLNGSKKILLPVFWVYIPVRYIYRTLVGKGNKISLARMNETLSRRKIIYNKIKFDD